MAQQQQQKSWFDNLGSNITQFAQRSIQLGQQGLNQTAQAMTVVANKTVEYATIAGSTTVGMLQMPPCNAQRFLKKNINC